MGAVPEGRVGPMPEASPDTIGTQVLPRPGFRPPTPTAGSSAPADPDLLVTELLRGLPRAAPAPGAEPGPGSSGAPLTPALDPGVHHTQALDPALAAAMADPFRDTSVLRRPDDEGEDRPAAAAGPAPLLSRRRAAEVGLYCGASLVLLAVLGMGVRGWGQWQDGMRAAASALASLLLLASGLFLRLPWRSRMSDERNRAVSVMLGTGVAASLVGSAIVLGVSQSSDPVGAAVQSGTGVLLLVGVNLVARTPFSETLLLGSICWLAWLTLPWRPGLWLVLAGLGVLWLLAGQRLGRGPRTAAVAGCTVALAAGAALAAEPDAWVARGVLAAVTAVGLGLFRAGRANYWLALGAAAATALAAAVAAAALSPAPALMIGGLATMAVSGVALRAARPAK